MSPGPQVLWLRIGNASKSKLIASIEERWPQILAFLDNREAIVEM
jgi:predicted nuclease of predicted toxin-antitoxin system